MKKVRIFAGIVAVAAIVVCYQFYRLRQEQAQWAAERQASYIHQTFTGEVVSYTEQENGLIMQIQTADAYRDGVRYIFLTEDTLWGGEAEELVRQRTIGQQVRAECEFWDSETYAAYPAEMVTMPVS